MNEIRHRIVSATLYRVLLAEPDAVIRALYAETLRQAQCEVVEAADGRDALVKAFVRAPSLVVTALHLPMLDGYALCTILRLDPMTARVPILVVTMETRPAELLRAQQSGANVVLTKPTSPECLRMFAQRLLTRSADLRDRSSATLANANRQLEESAKLLTRSQEHRRKGLSKSHARYVTVTPPMPPPNMTCP